MSLDYLTVEAVGSRKIGPTSPHDQGAEVAWEPAAPGRVKHLCEALYAGS